MSIIWWVLFFLFGYAILFLSAEFLVEEIIESLERFNISPIVFGVLFLGIEVEESSASIFAAANDLPLLSIGNLIGNSIIAITIAFGIPFLLLKPKQEEFPMFYPTVLLLLIINIFLAMMFPSELQIFSVIAISAFPVIVAYSIILQKNYNTSESNISPSDADADEDQDEISGLNLLARVIFGFILILLGGQILVLSASEIIEQSDINESFFGLIIMAFVTNGEEFFLMLSALRKGQYQLGLGTQIGKIIWNLSLVFGISGLLIGSFDKTTVFIRTSLLLVFNGVLLLFLIKLKRFSTKSSWLFIIISLIFLVLSFQNL
ncbi:MAG: sodium:calcium antiporter [Candidatus Kariarchaeaceae archaeon]